MNMNNVRTMYSVRVVIDQMVPGIVDFSCKTEKEQRIPK